MTSVPLPPGLLNRAEIPVVILCGGMGTRLREASEKLPKPLVDIGGNPILWHIMKTYGAHGFRRFVLCLGYKGELIKQYFLDYRTRASDFTLRMGDEHSTEFHSTSSDEDWEVTFAETGLLSGTGARLRRVAKYVDSDTFLATYGDGIGDVDISAVLTTHLQAGTVGTVTGVHPSSRYGEMRLSENGTGVAEFNEKPTVADGWVSGGFFAFQRSFLEDYLDDDPTRHMELGPLQRLARDKQLSVHRHEGFWMGMDTYRDWLELNARWDTGDAPWMLWKDNGQR